MRSTMGRGARSRSSIRRCGSTGRGCSRRRGRRCPIPTSNDGASGGGRPRPSAPRPRQNRRPSARSRRPSRPISRRLRCRKRPRLRPRRKRRAPLNRPPRQPLRGSRPRDAASGADDGVAAVEASAPRRAPQPRPISRTLRTRSGPQIFHLIRPSTSPTQSKTCSAARPVQPHRRSARPGRARAVGTATVPGSASYYAVLAVGQIATVLATVLVTWAARRAIIDLTL